MKAPFFCLVFAASGLTVFSGQSLAEPDVCEVDFFSEFDAPGMLLDTRNVLVGENRFDGSFAVSNQLGITLQEIGPGLPGVATRNIFDGPTGDLDLSCVWVGPQAFWAGFGLTETSPQIHFDIQAAGLVVEAQRTPDWTVQWGPCGTALGNTSSLVFDGAGGVLFDGFTGTVSQSRSAVEILLEGGASWFRGQVTPGQMSGEGNHFFNDVCWEASPNRPGNVLSLLEGHFRADVTWRTATSSGQGTAVPYTDFNGGFWFFTPDNIELVVRVLDACDSNDRFWVFAAATTDVEFDLDVTDTISGQTRTYSNPLGNPAPAITDTSAFATCP